ncbi:MAG: hypothetical protein HY671_04465 [Chloroflexi bacterium]|nr:hypothetical protein [Chloroflexota bacterium]
MSTANLDDFQGRVLVADLSRGEMTTEKVSGEALLECLGGASLGAKLLYERVAPGVGWNDPANCLIIASGPLGGTSVPGSGTICVISKGALTEGGAVTQANSFFGAYLRHCGFDAILVTGAASRLSYLHVYTGGAAIRDASHLAGKDTWETGDLLRQDLRGPRDISVVSIGPAGENLVRWAGIICDRGHAAAHNGVGAVMGSKKLKAIAVEAGSAGIPMKDSRRFLSLAVGLSDGLRNASPADGMNTFRWGTLNGVFRNTEANGGNLPVKNYTTNIYDIERDRLERFKASNIRSQFGAVRTPCFACPMHHSHVFTVPEGPFKGRMVDEPEYEGLAAWGPVTGQTDATWSIVLADLADRLGLDTNEGGWVVGMAMECFEKGLIASKDCDGLQLTWGNGEATYALLNNIARRRGFGNVLAEGVMRAARQIGGEAAQLAVHTRKGNSPRGHDHRAVWPEMFDTCISNTGTLESGGRVMERQVAKYKDLPKYDHFSPEGVPLLNALIKGAMLFEDSLGVCRFTTNTDMQLLVDLVEAAAGWKLTIDEALTVGRRAANRLRVFNIRQGISPELDGPSSRYGSTPVNGPAKGKNVMPEWPKMLGIYYRAMGWDERGVPLPETLRGLGLEELAADLPVA